MSIEKDFDSWNSVKKDIEVSDRKLFFHEREVWWCSFGINIGIEADGKREHYKRPALIIRKFNNQMVWAIPLTSKNKQDKFHCQVELNNKIVFCKLTQIRVISEKRLGAKMGMISKIDFELVKSKILKFF